MRRIDSTTLFTFACMIICLCSSHVASSSPRTGVDTTIYNEVVHLRDALESWIKRHGSKKGTGRSLPAVLPTTLENFGSKGWEGKMANLKKGRSYFKKSAMSEKYGNETTYSSLFGTESMQKGLDHICSENRVCFVDPNSGVFISTDPNINHIPPFVPILIQAYGCSLFYSTDTPFCSLSCPDEKNKNPTPHAYHVNISAKKVRDMLSRGRVAVKKTLLSPQIDLYRAEQHYGISPSTSTYDVNNQKAVLPVGSFGVMAIPLYLVQKGCYYVCSALSGTPWVMEEAPYQLLATQGIRRREGADGYGGMSDWDVDEYERNGGVEAQGLIMAVVEQLKLLKHRVMGKRVVYPQLHLTVKSTNKLNGRRDDMVVELKQEMDMFRLGEEQGIKAQMSGEEDDSECGNGESSGQFSEDEYIVMEFKEPKVYLGRCPSGMECIPKGARSASSGRGRRSW